MGDLHWVVGVGTHPASKPGQPDDRWMVTHSTYWRALLAALDAMLAYQGDERFHGASRVTRQ